MNKPIQTEVRGKKNRHQNNRSQGVKPEDELKETLAQSEPTAVEQTSHTEAQIEQAVDAAREDAAKALGVSPENVTMYPVAMQDDAAWKSDDPMAQLDLSPESINAPRSFHNELEGDAVRGQTTAVANAGNALRSLADAAMSGALLDQPILRPEGATAGDNVKALLAAAHRTLGGSVDEETLRECIEALCVQLKPYAAQSVNGSDAAYRDNNLELIITRYPKGMTEEGRFKLQRMICHLPAVVDGFTSGFTITGGDRPVFKLSQGEISLQYEELRDKIITRYYENWGERISLHGVNEATTFDFMAIELSEDRQTVISVWECLQTHPTYLSGIVNRRQKNSDPNSTWGLSVHMSAKVSRGTELNGRAVMLAAQALWDQTQPTVS